jgi:hypothetical protein
MFHLICNAVKHGVKHSQVQLNFAYDKKSAELVAEISNFFSEFNEETWQKNIRGMFSF